MSIVFAISRRQRGAFFNLPPFVENRVVTGQRRHKLEDASFHSSSAINRHREHNNQGSSHLTRFSGSNSSLTRSILLPPHSYSAGSEKNAQSIQPALLANDCNMRAPSHLEFANRHTFSFMTFVAYSLDNLTQWTLSMNVPTAVA